MSEPKYMLNKHDRERHHALITRKCLQEFGKSSKHFPALTPAEERELERLTQEQRRRIGRHPKVREHRRLDRNHRQRMQRLVRKIDALAAKHKLPHQPWYPQLWPKRRKKVVKRNGR